MKKQLFSSVDTLLPRWVALIPYELALRVCQISLGTKGEKAEVWKRNSTILGSFVFGLSDLDLTILTSNELSFEKLGQKLRSLKKPILFLGEANYYCKKDLSWIGKYINLFELKRDPLLMRMMDSGKKENDIEALVFILRMLDSDFMTLKEMPHIRQKKWSQHFLSVSANVLSPITLQQVIDYLRKGFKSEGLGEALNSWVGLMDKNTFEPFKDSHHSFFKVLFPHKHLWFHDGKDEKAFLNGLNEFEKSFLLSQIDWEIWGIYTQRFWLKAENSLIHLGRLLKVREVIRPLEDTKEISQRLSSVFKI